MRMIEQLLKLENMPSIQPVDLAVIPFVMCEAYQVQDLWYFSRCKSFFFVPDFIPFCETRKISGELHPGMGNRGCIYRRLRQSCFRIRMTWRHSKQECSHLVMGCRTAFKQNGACMPFKCGADVQSTLKVLAAISPLLLKFFLGELL